ncbi:restriction endonuclease subunit S [Clostridium perfringens]|uniref:restriction endonuclease subunit S n=1 Tax=Clostridium perfringens TaxID=1502 RepID=UPI00244A7F79|nr:restriction endonuclease subunit S [Clostridium perfringens]MDH2340058.1 restriction endonuclease subunit S [Clostridium perfringens]MDN4737792.1 restriction endonuclease subunit S [Clostridium perfringens]MDN4741088.1 restriction endonuclease subunit S [Clostridium perfringens]
MKKEAREGYKMTELGEIPNEWQIKNLEDISYLIDGDRSSRYPGEKDIVEHGILFLSTQNIIDSKIVYKNCKFITEEKFDELSKGKLQKNDLIITLRGSIGNVAKFNGDIYETGFINAQIMIIRSNDINPTYLSKYLISVKSQKQITSISSGSAQPQLTKSELKKLKVIVPSEYEQKKIVEILSTVDEQIENTEKLIQKNQELKKGLMQQLLTKGIGHTEFKKTEIGSVPIEWEIKNLEYLVEIRNGNSPSNFTLNETGKYPFFKVDDMNYTNKYLNKAKVYFDDCKYSLMIKGMIVFPKRGASIFTNKIAILNLNGYFDTNIMGLKCKDELINEYLFYYLKFIGLERFADTTAVPQINNKHINPLKIPIPSIIEQEKIVWGLDQIDGKIEQYKNKKEKLEYLKGGLMQDLLLGKIRVI